MGRPVGTIKSWRARGRERLRSRLIRRGLAPSVGLAATFAANAAPVEPAHARARLELDEAHDRRERRRRHRRVFVVRREERVGEHAEARAELHVVAREELVVFGANAGAAFGAAILAGVSTAVFMSVDEAAARTLTITERVEPEAPKGSHAEAIGRYRSLYPALRPWFATGAASNS